MKAGRRARSAGPSATIDAQHRRSDLRPGDRRLHRASATSRAPSRAPPRPTCATPSTSGADILVRCRAERVLVEQRPRGRRRGDVRRPGDRPRRAGDRARAPGRRRLRRRSSRRRCCCAPGSAARRSASTCACTPAPRSSASTARTTRAWWGAPQAGLVRRVRRRRGRLRLPGRGRPVRDRRSPRSALPFTSRARAQGADDEASASARPSSACCATAATARSTSTTTARPSPLRAHRRARRPQHAPRDRRPGPAAPGGRSARDPRARHRRRRRWRVGDDLDACIARCSACRCAPAG